MSDVRDVLICGSEKIIGHYRFLLSRTTSERESANSTADGSSENSDCSPIFKAVSPKDARLDAEAMRRRSEPPPLPGSIGSDREWVGDHRIDNQLIDRGVSYLEQQVGDARPACRAAASPPAKQFVALEIVSTPPRRRTRRRKTFPGWRPQLRRLRPFHVHADAADCLIVINRCHFLRGCDASY